MGGAALPVIGSVAGGAMSLMGANKQADAQAEAAEASRELPEWLKPYMVGDAGPEPEPIPINYNWLDSLQQIGTSGMPGMDHPMSMNDPRMTFDNVHTPYEGGPWGMGLGPGVPTQELGIPGAPGTQFASPPEGFVPGAPAAPGADGQGGGASLLDEDLLRLAKWRQRGSGGGGMSDGVFNTDPMSSMDALLWAQKNSDAFGAMDQGYGSSTYDFYQGSGREPWSNM